MGSASFYHSEVFIIYKHQITKVNEVMLYNLKPNTTSWWKDIKVCKERCDNFAYADKILILFTIFILLL